MNSDCYEKGHTPAGGWGNEFVCAKCREPVTWARLSPDSTVMVLHTQAGQLRLDGVDPEASRVLGEERDA